MVAVQHVHGTAVFAGLFIELSEEKNGGNFGISAVENVTELHDGGITTGPRDLTLVFGKDPCELEAPEDFV